MSARRNIAERRPVSTIRPAMALTVSLRQASVTKSAVTSAPSSSGSTARAAGSSGSRMRASSTTRTWPGSSVSVAIQTIAGTTVASPANGPTTARCSTPFWSTTTVVPGPHSAARNGAAASVWCALTASSTTSARHGTSPGSVSTGPGTTTVSPPRSTTSRSSGVRPQSTRSAPARCTTAATVDPIAPGPTTATRFTQPRGRAPARGRAAGRAPRPGRRCARRSCSRHRTAGGARRRACASRARTRRRPDSARTGRAARR